MANLYYNRFLYMRAPLGFNPPHIIHINRLKSIDTKLTSLRKLVVIVGL